MQKGCVALLSPSIKMEKMAYLPLLNRVVHGIVSELSDRGLNLIQNTFGNFPTLLAKHQVDGVIIWPDLTGISDVTIEMLRSYPVVYVMSIPEERLPGDRVKTNNNLVGALAANYLLSKGHRHIACVTTAGLESFLWERSSSFLRVAEAQGISATLLALETGDADLDTVNTTELESCMTRGLRRILNCTPRPTGLFVTCDALTAHVYHHLKRLGIQIGKELEIISCNNEISTLNCLDPRPKSIDLNAEGIGRKAVERLLARILDPMESSYFCVEVEPHLY